MATTDEILASGGAAADSLAQTPHTASAGGDFAGVIGDIAHNIFAFDSDHPLIFTQFYFWAFFACVLVVLAAIRKSRIMLRNTFLFLVSVFFYYKTSGDFTLLLIVATALSYLVGRKISDSMKGSDAPPLRAKAWLGAGIVIELVVLFYFKYSYLVADMLNHVLGTSIEVRDYLAELGNALAGRNKFSIDYIWLPVGISFYTFQCISYMMDIYRRRIEPLSNVADYGFYVSFFPQLVAGPIVRANEFVGQISKPYFLSRRWFGIAIFWILNGLAKKIILADFLAVNFADRVFSNPTM